MRKGESTRQTILQRALVLARTLGLEGVTLGRLAKGLGLSKSGLFAHFRSKEELQIQVIQTAAAEFKHFVITPALRKPRGEPYIHALFERYLKWAERPGGCIFISAAAELDDQPGPVRDVLAHVSKEWIRAVAKAAQDAVEEGHFRKDLDTQQFAFEFQSLLLGAHHALRLLDDAKALHRSRLSFKDLLARTR
jgi:AcrR family transcriptional regulator